MERGEWTKSKALALATALEAMILEMDHRGLGHTPVKLISEVRTFNRGSTEPIRGGHIDRWFVDFDGARNHVNLTCGTKGITCRENGHTWVRREVEIVIESYQSPGRVPMNFHSEGEEPLVRTVTMSWNEQRARGLV